jgi:Ni/Fe-hydrogenase 1 B-type cytochrome subunit
MATQAGVGTTLAQPEYHYEWNWAYRADHWVRVAAFAVLVLTGFYIERPFAGPWGSTHAAYHAQAAPVMAWMRFAHFVAGYALVLGLVVRVYLAFASRFDADWRDFGLGRNLRDVPDIALYYLFLKPSHKPYRRYNPLQALTYLVWAGLLVVQSLTGFALYHGTVFGVLRAPDRFRWVQHWLGGEPNVRLVHQLVMWVFLVTIMVHVYMAAMVAWTRRDHSFRAMFTGYTIKRRS